MIGTVTWRAKIISIHIFWYVFLFFFSGPSGFRLFLKEFQGFWSWHLYACVFTSFSQFLQLFSVRVGVLIGGPAIEWGSWLGVLRSSGGPEWESWRTSGGPEWESWQLGVLTAAGPDSRGSWQLGVRNTANLQSIESSKSAIHLICNLANPTKIRF